MELLYFAQLRENIGHASENLTLPENILNIKDLINYLCNLDENYRSAFENEALLRVAVNQQYVTFNHPIQDGDEIAFFPPMTGG